MTARHRATGPRASRHASRPRHRHRMARAAPCAPARAACGATRTPPRRLRRSLGTRHRPREHLAADPAGCPGIDLPAPHDAPFQTFPAVGGCALATDGGSLSTVGRRPRSTCAIIAVIGGLRRLVVIVCSGHDRILRQIQSVAETPNPDRSPELGGIARSVCRGPTDHLTLISAMTRCGAVREVATGAVGISVTRPTNHRRLGSLSSAHVVWFVMQQGIASSTIRLV